MTRTAHIISRLADLAGAAVDETCFAEWGEAELDRIEDFCAWLEEAVYAVEKRDAA